MAKKSIVTIQIWLRDAAEELAMAGIASALLDAEIILSHTLRQSRTWLHAHGDDEIDPRRLEITNARLDLRKDRVPVAYIIGHKEFYGRLFKVTPSVLIPRPESEALIELMKRYLSNTSGSVIDVGTGSGCLGITTKLELPDLTVTLSDTSRHALKVAEANANYLGATVETQLSDLLEKTSSVYDAIIANLPYVDRDWERSPETNHEPAEALFADDGGLALIRRLIAQTDRRLKTGGLLFLEADPEQHPAITEIASEHRLVPKDHQDYALVFEKV